MTTEATPREVGSHGVRLNRHLGVIGGNMRETTFKILTQGDVQMAHCQGYMVAGGEDAALTGRNLPIVFGVVGVLGFEGFGFGERCLRFGNAGGVALEP